ncbi:hypothetical protein BGAL_0463g00070 [Botrytis galanthina]|uniref:Uncharacterized protein n=1 Tax=Botrytis galanthina TaxID=278940 RepID=A0A4S8QXZ3_9HELO|nr:hypothetical protein BGAL_0463g00070 [Botrytis galanthina]
MVISSRSGARLPDSTSDNLQTTTRSIKHIHAFNSRQRTFSALHEHRIRMQSQLTTILSGLALMSGSVKVLAAPTPVSADGEDGAAVEGVECLIV